MENGKRKKKRRRSEPLLEVCLYTGLPVSIDTGRRVSKRRKGGGELEKLIKRVTVRIRFTFTFACPQGGVSEWVSLVWPGLLLRIKLVVKPTPCM